MRTAALAVLAALAVAAPAAAAPYVVDKSHAAVTFSVSHLGFSNTFGVFREFDAEIDFDPENMAASSVTFTIQAGSVDTFWAARDKHLKSGDFLAVAEHPTITFKSTKVEMVDAETAKLTGDVTLRGVTHTEVFTAKLNKFGPHPFQKTKKVAGFTVTGELDRKKYGMTYGVPAIGQVIPLRIDIEINDK